MSPLVLYPLPEVLQHVPAIERTYPGLARRERRRRHTSWEHLRRMARTRWVHQHPGIPAAETAAVRWGGSIEASFRRTWTRLGVPAWRQARLACFVRNEGGFDVMDRWYGPGKNYRGWATAVRLGFVGTDRVEGPGQVRPMWIRIAHPQWLERVVTYRSHVVLTNPYDHALIMARLPDYMWAGTTRGACP